MGEERQRVRESVFLFWGVLMGVVLGLLGNLFTNFWYDVYRTAWWMPYAGWGSYVVLLIIVVIMGFQIQRWLRQAR